MTDANPSNTWQQDKPIILATLELVHMLLSMYQEDIAELQTRLDALETRLHDHQVLAIMDREGAESHPKPSSDQLPGPSSVPPATTNG